MFGQKPYWLGAEIEFKQIIPKDLSQLRPVPDTLKQFGCEKERIHASIVAKKWEPRNPVPSRFSAQIRKVEARLGKLAKIRKVETN